jgi:hypothetical protein
MMKANGVTEMGCTFDSFQEPMPASECTMSKEWLSKYGPMGVDESWRGNVHRRLNSYTETWFHIHRVLINEGDSIRAIFLTDDSLYPDYILTQEDVGRNYTRLDPGNWMQVSNSSSNIVYTVKDALTAEEFLEAFPEYNKAHTAQQKDYNSQLVQVRKKQLHRYATRKTRFCFASIFTIESKKFTYSDTVVTAQTRDEATELASWLIRQYSDDFDTILISMLKDTELRISVNNCSVQYSDTVTSSGAQLHYVNGKKISAPDLDEVLQRVTCYPDNQEAYDTYVARISRISLKFHRSVTEGIDFRLNNTGSIAHFLGAEQDMPELAIGGSDSLPGTRVSDSSIKLKFRKERAGKKGEVFFIEKWRTVSKFDTFLDRAGAGSIYHGNNGYFCTTNIRRSCDAWSQWDDLKSRYGDAVMEALDSLVRKLVLMDNFFDPGDRVFAGFYRHLDSKGALQPSSTLDPSTDLIDFCIELCTLFASDFKTYLEEEVQRIKASRESLEAAIKRTSTEVIQNHPHHHRRVYRVTGKSGLRYDIREDTAAVYDANTNGHICIVKASSELSFGYDYIISLINSLANDSRTAKNIYTVNNLLGKREEVEA